MITCFSSVDFETNTVSKIYRTSISPTQRDNTCTFTYLKVTIEEHIYNAGVSKQES